MVDGAPASLREFVDFVAGQLGTTPPPSVSLEVAVADVGEIVATHLAADRATSNQKLTGLGWRPRFPSYRDGVPGVLKEIFPRASGRSR